MTSRDELREHLVATIEAAPELPKDAREHLADVFLDELNAEYDLVPHGPGTRSQSARPAGRPVWSGRWVPIALLFAFLIFVVPAALHHFPIFLLAIVIVFFVVRRAKSRRPWTPASS